MPAGHTLSQHSPCWFKLTGRAISVVTPLICSASYWQFDLELSIKLAVMWSVVCVSGALTSQQFEELYFSSCKCWRLSQVILSYKSFRFHEKCYNTRSWPSESPESASYFMRGWILFCKYQPTSTHNICVGPTGPCGAVSVLYSVSVGENYSIDKITSITVNMSSTLQWEDKIYLAGQSQSQQ